VGQQPFGGARASNDKAGSPLNLLRWVSQEQSKKLLLLS
jgi:1-pyrroline-5-carboxylate dehydrogenase